MASVTTHPFNHEETQRHVRHPLQVLRKYIRRYVVLEGLALTALCMAVLFWLGLALDFGLYKFDFDLRQRELFTFNVPPLHVHGIDWLQELNDLDTSGFSSYWVRVILLTACVVGLLVLGISKVVVRWVREFNDRTLALVLERRFHRQLGDRLITAVELADPQLSKKYGYSQAMVEKTILDAVATLKQLPVSGVFNWRRLSRLWLLLGFATIGLWLILMAVFCLGSLLTDHPMSPYGFAWRFYDVSSIWVERNVCMMNSYWPRRSYLEVGRFQPARDNPTDMRVARDDARPDLQVRAVEWVVADRDVTHAPQGWRALTWSDLPRFVEKDLLDKVTIPQNFADWKIDPDELEPSLAAALFGTETQPRTSGEIRAHLQKPHIKEKIDQRGAQGALDAWLDWRQWTVDKLALQMEETDVRNALRIQAAPATVDEYAKLELVFTELNEQAESPSLSRTLRRLRLPDEVDVTFRGEETGSNSTIKRESGNKFTVPLKDLKDSTRFRFRARGEDFYTAPKYIVLVAAPTASAITIDKEEPAYIYHRLHGVDQSPLRGVKHITKDYPLSTTGDTNTIEVPLGANLVIRVQTDRKLRGEKSVFSKDPPVLEQGFDTFRGRIELDKDDQGEVGSGFTLHMNDLSRKHDFAVEFFDEDNIRGKRRFKVLSVIDTEPQVGNLGVFNYNPRKPKVKAVTVDKDKDKEQSPRDQQEHAEIVNSYLVTPDALLPFECMVKDDYGLVRVGYQYRLRQVYFELMGQGTKKLPTPEIQASAQKRYAVSIASALQYWPGNPASWLMGREYVALIPDIVQTDIRQAQGYKDMFVPSEGFRGLLERKSAKMIHLGDLSKNLSIARTAQSWDFDFKQDHDDNGNLGFDIRKLLPSLKSVDPENVAQFHYLLQISVQATDNNVETGSQFRDEKGNLLRGNSKKNKNGYVSFLVVSENELLSQIALEEESLFEKLEIAKEKVDAGITSLQEQMAKLRDDKVDMDNVLNRMNEIRTALSGAGNNLREAQLAYDNILKEMVVNRVKSERMTKIKEKIVYPLEDIILQNGSYAKAEDAFLNVHQLVEKDVGAMRTPDAELHRQNMTEAGKHMDKLSKDIKQVLDSMSEGIVESKLIAILVSIEQGQRADAERLSRLYTELIDDTLRRLLEGEKNDKK